MVSIYKDKRNHTYPKALPQNLGRKKHQIFDHFLRHFCTQHRISPEQNVKKCWCQSTMCPLKVDLLSVIFDPETAEIHFIIATHPMAAITLQPS